MSTDLLSELLNWLLGGAIVLAAISLISIFRAFGSFQSAGGIEKSDGTIVNASPQTVPPIQVAREMKVSFPEGERSKYLAWANLMEPVAFARADTTLAGMLSKYRKLRSFHVHSPSAPAQMANEVFASAYQLGSLSGLISQHLINHVVDKAVAEVVNQALERMEFGLKDNRREVLSDLVPLSEISNVYSNVVLLNDKRKIA